MMDFFLLIHILKRVGFLQVSCSSLFVCMCAPALTLVDPILLSFIDPVRKSVTARFFVFYTVGLNFFYKDYHHQLVSSDCGVAFHFLFEPQHVFCVMVSIKECLSASHSFFSSFILKNNNKLLILGEKKSEHEDFFLLFSIFRRFSVYSYCFIWP